MGADDKKKIPILLRVCLYIIILLTVDVPVWLASLTSFAFGGGLAEPYVRFYEKTNFISGQIGLALSTVALLLLIAEMVFKLKIPIGRVAMKMAIFVLCFYPFIPASQLCMILTTVKADFYNTIELTFLLIIFIFNFGIGEIVIRALDKDFDSRRQG